MCSRSVGGSEGAGWQAKGPSHLPSRSALQTLLL